MPFLPCADERLVVGKLIALFVVVGELVELAMDMSILLFRVGRNYQFYLYFELLFVCL